MDISAEQRKKVKGEGFLSNRDGEHFSARVITRNGVLNSNQLRLLGEAADKFGNGSIAFTTRLTLELPGIKFKDIENFKEYISKENMETGGTGSKVRPVVACKGTVCTFGLIDTQGLAEKIHERFYKGYRDVVLPHKFKIAVGGCPNNCVKPDLNDLGIVGQRVPAFDKAQCRSCRVCGAEKACTMGAIQIKDDEAAGIDSSKCNNCGICANKCPFGAITYKDTKYKVYLGGRWGKKIRHGTALSALFNEEEVMNIVEKAILLFKSKGESGERFGSTIDRLGIEKVEKMLLSDNLLKRKDEILESETSGGASC